MNNRSCRTVRTAGRGVSTYVINTRSTNRNRNQQTESTTHQMNPNELQNINNILNNNRLFTHTALNQNESEFTNDDINNSILNNAIDEENNFSFARTYDNLVNNINHNNEIINNRYGQLEQHLTTLNEQLTLQLVQERERNQNNIRNLEERLVQHLVFH
jgi:hypothetical protein